MTNSKKIFDSWLVVQCQSGNEKGMTLLVKRWHMRFCKHAFYYTKDLDSAKDIAQDSWSIIMKRIGGLKDTNKFGSWAMAIVTRKSIDWLRKQKRETIQKEIYHDNATIISTNDLVDGPENALILMRQLIAQLPKEQKVVLTFFYTEEFTINEISRILNVPSGTIKSRLFKAREKLKQRLKNRNYEK
ncbi:MAG: RNA polymerase sigma factor [Bacteroidetes bacterium]|nr:RNA polymerase sigma factor [Bacteroidota bacterium]